MLVKVRLPATMPQLPQIPKMSIPVSMSDVDMTLSSFPSSSNILLSLLAVAVLVTFVRTLYLGLQEHFALVHDKKQRAAAVTVSSSPQEKQSAQRETTVEAPSSWLWGLVRWERHQPTHSTSSSEFTNEKQQQSWPQYEHRRTPSMSQVGKRTGPAFARPLPTLYESDIPVSMAKMIMSRHTFRRPTSRPPPARAANTVQIQRKMPSLVTPPTTSSSLSRPPSRSPSPPSPVSRSPSRSPSPPHIPSEEALRSSGCIV